MRLFLKLVFASPLLVILFAIIFVNINLVSQPVPGKSQLLQELRGLKNSIEHNADVEMQQSYPEGYVFMNAIYGLAWCNFLLRHDESRLHFREGGEEVMKAIAKIETNGREYFEADLPLSYGAFYNGWSSYLRGKKLQTDGNETHDAALRSVFQQQCDSMASALRNKVYPASYYSGTWPADVVMCVASLALHDKIFKPKYEHDIRRWLFQVRKLLGRDGLIPHAVDPAKGFSSEQARGSSQALMLIFLYEIDPRFARQQFTIFKEKFVDRKLGLTMVREYPVGVSGIGDVDSGPVIFGFGAAATIVGMQTLDRFGEHEPSSRINAIIDAVGMPRDTDNGRKYAFGQFPMADAFIAWSHSGMMNTIQSKPVFTTFHVYSTIVFALIACFFWILVRPEKPDSKKALNEVW